MVDVVLSTVPEKAAEKIREVVSLQDEEDEDTNMYEEIPIKLFNFLWDYKLEIAVATMFVITCIMLSIIIYAAFSTEETIEEPEYKERRIRFYGHQRSKSLSSIAVEESTLSNIDPESDFDNDENQNKMFDDQGQVMNYGLNDI